MDKLQNTAAPAGGLSEFNAGLLRNLDVNICKTCNFWKIPDNYYEEMIVEVDEPLFEVRICRHPNKRFCERPIEKNGFATGDAEIYCAILATAEEFGCVLHEAL